MRLQPCRVVAALGLLLALATPVGAQSFAWWKNDEFKKEVGLTTDQCTRIDAISWYPEFDFCSPAGRGTVPTPCTATGRPSALAPTTRASPGRAAA